MKAKQNYTNEEIDSMKEQLAESEWEGLKDRDLRRMTWEGHIGWKNIPDAEVVEHYQNIYGETDNVELVICDKRVTEQQGEIIAKFNDIK